MAVLGLSLVQAPTVEPVSLDEIHLHRRLDQHLEDAEIAAQITAARQYLETATGRAFITQTWKLVLDSFPTDQGGVLIPKPNLLAVSSITYINTAGQSTVLPTTDYLVDTYRQPGWVVPAYGLIWPSTRSQINAVEILYQAGYGPAAGDVPADLRNAIKLLVGHWYEHRESVTIGQLRVQSLPMAQGVDMAISAHWTGTYM